MAEELIELAVELVGDGLVPLVVQVWNIPSTPATQGVIQAHCIAVWAFFLGMCGKRSVLSPVAAVAVLANFVFWARNVPCLRWTIVVFSALRLTRKSWRDSTGCGAVAVFMASAAATWLALEGHVISALIMAASLPFALELN